MKNLHIVAIVLFMLNLCYICEFSDSSMVKIVVKIKDGQRTTVEAAMKIYGYSFYRQIIDNIYTYAKNRTDMSRHEDSNIAVLGDILSEKVEYLYRSKDLLLSSPTSRARNSSAVFPILSSLKVSPKDYECEPVFDPLFGIEEAWKQNITGKGVVIAIVDVGLDRYHPKLYKNINISLSWNFVDDNNEFEPEYYHWMSTNTRFTTHGNGDAVLTSGMRNVSSKCPFCGCGVAPDSTIAALKIAKLPENMFYHRGDHLQVDNDNQCSGLGYRTDEIDIYSSLLTIDTQPFQSSECIETVIKRNYFEGRNCKGNVYIFPSHPPENAFANNIYTIAVGEMGVYGTLAKNTQVNSAVLVSVFDSENRKHELSYLHEPNTHANHRSCRWDYNGHSAATAIVSGMIALVLQANQDLTARDVKHILVQSASSTRLQEENSFLTNHAGYKYHERFGFGYITMTKMIALSKGWKGLAPLYSETFSSEGNSNNTVDLHITHSQVAVLEQVVFSITVEAMWDLVSLPVTLIARSPSGTISVLVENHIMSGFTERMMPFTATFLSNHFWGEHPYGTWNIQLLGTPASRRALLLLKTVEMTIHGTENTYWMNKQHTDELQTDIKVTCINKLTEQNVSKQIDDYFSIKLSILCIVFTVCITMFLVVWRFKRNYFMRIKERWMSLMFIAYG